MPIFSFLKQINNDIVEMKKSFLKCSFYRNSTSFVNQSWSK